MVRHVPTFFIMGDRESVESQPSRYAMPRNLQAMIFLALILGGIAGEGRAQGSGNGAAAFRLDKRLFDSVYRIEAPAFRSTMRVADATAWPTFYGGAAAAWFGVWVVRGNDDFSDAYRLGVSELAALGATFGLKVLVRRTRPYVRFADVASRTGDIARKDPYAFPSGHAALSFALATSWTLSHPTWYVATPVYLWAATVSLSRVWLGVHYPSDVFFGAVLGTAIAWTVHELGSAITPAGLNAEEEPPPMPMLRLSLSLH